MVTLAACGNVSASSATASPAATNAPATAIPAAFPTPSKPVEAPEFTPAFATTSSTQTFNPESYRLEQVKTIEQAEIHITTLMSDTLIFNGNYSRLMQINRKNDELAQEAIIFLKNARSLAEKGSLTTAKDPTNLELLDAAKEVTQNISKARQNFTFLLDGVAGVEKQATGQSVDIKEYDSFQSELKSLKSRLEVIVFILEDAFGFVKYDCH
jgi:hypothetical protein